MSDLKSNNKQMSELHYLKIYPEFFTQVFLGNKTFEIRKNDRNFKTGDIVILQEYDEMASRYTGREIVVEIIFILDDKFIGLAEGYIAFSFDFKGFRNVKKTYQK